MPTEYTRGQLVAQQIKAHPEMTEEEIAATIDAHIRAATEPLVNRCKGLIEAFEAGDKWTSVSRRIAAKGLREDIAKSGH